jgi:HEPN domain-containing protein
MVREVKIGEAKNYMEKAEDFYGAASGEFEKGKYDVCVFNAAQSVILGNDCYCIFFLGKRPSKDHREAIDLHLEASRGRPSKKDVVDGALEKRGTFGYTERKATREEARIMMIKARRFLDWVKFITGISI